MTSPLPLKDLPEERRLATVLFARVHGLTLGADALDFEALTDLVRMIWRRMDEVFEAHGGVALGHMGDLMMAVWGAPTGSENDVEQAVKAALEAQKAIKELNREIHRSSENELKVSLTLHTGLMLAGNLEWRNEYTVMGDTVNVAAQIHHACEPDSILISEATYRLVRGAFQARRLFLPLNLRGDSEAIPVYVIEAVAQQLSRARYRSEDSVETCMVGREVEMERLTQLYESVVQDEKPALVLVTGEAGIGKSRLLMEFANSLEVSSAPVTVISARALSQTTQVPFYLWKALWFVRFGFRDGEPLESIRQRFVREIQRLWGFHLGPASSIEVAHLVGSLIGLPFEDSQFLQKYQNQSQKRLERGYEMTKELLRRMSAIRPLVLLLDDLQYADKNSLDLTLFLLEPSPYPLPLLILGGARPEFAQHNPRWLSAAHILELGPLAISAETVAAAYPALRHFPQVVLQEIAERSDGNPYFMEELAKSLLKSDMPLQGLSESELVERVRSLPLLSLRVMLQARLDSLSHEARSVALLASVVGRVFWVGAVYAAAQAGEKLATGGLLTAGEDVMDRLVQDALRQLVRAELAFPLANTPFSEEQEYIFKHSLLREIAYSLIPHKHLPYYHRAIAQWLEMRGRSDFMLMAADHYELAQDFEMAAQLYEQAAGQILRQGAEREAQDLMQKAQLLRSKTKEA